MPSTSDKQQRFFGAVFSCKTKGDCPSDKIKKTADSMTKNQIKDFLHKETVDMDFIKFLHESYDGSCECQCSSCLRGDCGGCTCENCRCKNCFCR